LRLGRRATTRAVNRFKTNRRFPDVLILEMTDGFLVSHSGVQLNRRLIPFQIGSSDGQKQDGNAHANESPERSGVHYLNRKALAPSLSNARLDAFLFNLKGRRRHYGDLPDKERAYIQRKVGGGPAEDKVASSGACFPACPFGRAAQSLSRARR
jgi:hypothetical protein